MVDLIGTDLTEDGVMLDRLQRAAFGYFLQAVDPANGLVADTSRESSSSSIAVVGFALSAYPVAVERGWMARDDAVDRSLAALRFFRDSDQSGSPEATGYKGFYYHFLDVHQFSHAWIDFRGIQDRFMREKRCDYFENSRRATCVQREYAQRNPNGFIGHDENCWGLSACDGPSDERPEVSNEPRHLFGYAARGVPYGPDDGTLAGCTALASLPFAPDIAWRAARNMSTCYPEMLSDTGTRAVSTRLWQVGTSALGSRLAATGSLKASWS